MSEKKSSSDLKPGTPEYIAFQARVRDDIWARQNRPALTGALPEPPKLDEGFGDAVADALEIQLFGHVRDAKI